MKKCFLLSLIFILFLGKGVVFAQSNVISLYDQVLHLDGCIGVSACQALDGEGIAKKVRIERFVPGSGYLAVYFQDKSVHSGGFSGGFNLDRVTFEPHSGASFVMGVSQQIFERGTIVLEFDQPYDSSQRFETAYDLVISYLPHTDTERQRFLMMLQDDPQKFFDYKTQEMESVSPLCQALGRTSRLPSSCPDQQSTTLPPSPGFDSNSSTFRTNPNSLPELDFTGKSTRAPVVTLRDEYRQAFVGEPVLIEVKEVSDPDGKCQFFQYQWSKPTSMQLKDVDVDPLLGDLFFVPLNPGAYTFRLRVREYCQELGTLMSNTASVSVIVNDKSLAFSDLSDAPQYQNSIYQLYHMGVVQGYPDGTMRPNAPINRAEFLKILFVALSYKIDQSAYSPRYPDVLPEQWFAKFVHQADTLSVIEGYPDGRFHPEWTVNLVEALKMAMNFTDLEIKDDTIYSFPDVPNEDWYSRYVKTAFREGILDDITPGKNVRPGQLLTRGKAMQIVVRTLVYPVNRINYTNRDVLRKEVEYEDFTGFVN